MWWFSQPELKEQVLGELVGAGFEIKGVEASEAAGPRAGAAEAATAAEAADVGPSIAVLPFTDMSPAQDQVWFCEGIAEELLNGLGRVKGLRVAARASAFQFKGEPLQKIGDALSVATVLDGSVRTAGDRLRITVQLINVADGFQRWNESYDRTIEDVFAIQDEIAANIIEALELELGTQSGENLAMARATENLEAYQAYLQGRHLWLQRRPETMQRAEEYFEKALELDPNYALAYTGFSDLYNAQIIYGLRPPSEALPKAAAAAEKAAELAPRLSEAQAALVFLRGFNQRKWDLADEAATRAVELRGNNPIAPLWSGLVSQAFGRVEEASERMEMARSIDPLSPYVAALEGINLVSQHRDAEAMRRVEQSLEVNPDYPVGLFTLAWASQRSGRIDEGVAAVERAVGLTERASFYVGTFGWALACAGRADEARGILEELETRSQSEHVREAYRAWVLLGLGEIEPAMKHLEAGFLEGDPWLAFPDLSLYDPVRADARFVVMLRESNYPCPEPPAYDV
jgi:TolB-like protein